MCIRVISIQLFKYGKICERSTGIFPKRIKTIPNIIIFVYLLNKFIRF